MAVYKQKGSKNWWYKFTWKGETIRETTKQSNKRIAEQIEAARKTQLAKGEVGFKDRAPVPTLNEFAMGDFLPFVRSTFASKEKTQAYYENGVKQLLSHAELALERLDRITSETISGFVGYRRNCGLAVSSINRELQTLRRMFALAQEWGRVEKALPRVRMLPGEHHRDRVLTGAEEQRYFDATLAIGRGFEEAYRKALEGTRAKRGHKPTRPADPFLLRDVAAILDDCALRPEECFRLRSDDVRSGMIEVQFGKTENARRRIPISSRVAAILEMRSSGNDSGWAFPATTKSGHVEPSSLKKQHARACAIAGLEPFPLYTFRHTCLTRWAAHMDPYTLAYLAGHSDFSITRRYVHPQLHTVQAAMERARNAQDGHSIGHSDEKRMKA
ncbi:MAG: tyrosine-type recombinase/integrase [Acidobacteriaceae bacterium]|nr:tyrosine-type recombinase/integrase [Acidobacteriaceae bacterium]